MPSLCEETKDTEHTLSEEFTLDEGNYSESSLLDISFREAAPKRTSKRVSADIAAEITGRLMSPMRRRESKAIQELTINKLHYDSVGLVGREKETQTLHECLSRLTASMEGIEPRKKELIYIKGYSGVGKSTMAKTLEKPMSKLPNGIMVRGKFDQNDRDEPYAAIAQAFGAMCRKVNRTAKQNPVRAETIVSKLGTEIYLLAKLIPELKEMAGPNRGRKSSFSDSADYDAGQKRWKYAFRLLTRALGSFFSPMIIVLDDLQWADVSSLEVIDFLLSDTQNENAMMVIGCYRSNEVNAAHILTDKMNELTDKKDSCRINLTSITVGSFKVAEVNKIVMALLSLDDESKTQALANLCFKRTNGNPFFLIEFMTMLVEEELLVFNIGLLKWIWDVKAIENATVSTSNVVHLLQAKMRKMSPKAQLLLEYAACLGSSFAPSTIDLIWQKHAVSYSQSFHVNEDVSEMLIALVGRNFLEIPEMGVYRWVHDRVQEAALSLGEARKPSFQFEIGSILYHHLEMKQLDDSLFDVVNLINNGNMKRKPEYAVLNLKTAEKALGISAFRSASKYVEMGIQLLPTSKWSSHKELTLRLYTIGAEVELALGNTEVMEKYSDEVLSQQSCTTLDKVPVYTAKFHKLSNVDLKYDDTINFCLAVLKELDISVVPSPAILLPVKALQSLLSTTHLAKNTPKEAFMDPPVMADPKHKAAMLFLFRLLYASYLSKNDFLLIRSTTRMVKMTLKYGVSTMAGPAFATLGLLIIAVLGDFKTGSYLAECALLIQKALPSKYGEANTLFASYNFVLSWTKPLQSCYAPFQQAYVSGMRSGNTEYSMWALIVHHVFLPYHMGKPLELTLANCPTCASQTQEVRQQDQTLFLKIFWQVILNLMGKSTETKRLKGDIFDGDEFVRTTSLHDAVYNHASLDLLMFFGDYEEGAKLAIKVGDAYQKAFPGFLLGMIEQFHRGVCLYAMARRTGKRKYKTRAAAVLKTIKSWMDKGNPNVQHFHSLLAAEQAALNKNNEAAEELYQDAIRTAARNGSLHHAGLINERYADFARTVLKDEEEAKHRIAEAVRFYTAWGAEAKVEMLRKEQ
eukprot:scaffold2499_cov125-Cylindrotheca_fusiformis.AAC.27